MWLTAARRCVRSYPSDAAAQLTHISWAARKQPRAAASIVPAGTARCYATGPTEPENLAGVSLASAANLNAGSSHVSSKTKSSRFVRTYGNAAPPATSGADPESGAIPQGEADARWPALHVNLSAPPGLTSAAAVAAYLQRLQSLLRHRRHPFLRACAVRELGKILLPSVKGIDGATVLLLLQTLRMADADDAMPLVQDAATWMGLHGFHLTPPQMTTAIELLLYFDRSVACELAVALVQRTSLSTLFSFSTARVVPILTAMLPTLTYGRNSNRALQSLAQLEEVRENKVSAAEGLRDACLSDELMSVSSGGLVQLLRALWAFKRANQGFYSTAAATEWRSLEEAVCGILATPEKCAEALLSELINVMADLTQWREQRKVSDSAETAVNSAQEKLFTAFLVRLEAITERIRSCSPESTVKGSILPEPLTMSDVSVAWSHCLAHTESRGPSSDFPSLAASGNGANAADTFGTPLQALQAALWAVVGARYSAESQSIDAMQLAAFMCSEVVVSWMTHAHQERDEALAQSAGDDISAVLPDLASLIPEATLQGLMNGISAQLLADSITWTPQMVRQAVTLLGNSRDPAHRARALQLARKWYGQLQSRAQEGERLQPIELLAFFVPTLLQEEKKDVAQAVRTSLSRWSVAEVLYFFSEIAMHGGRAGGVESMTVLRDSGKLLGVYAAKASAPQLVGLVECYGLAQVRSDDFCEAVASRVSELLRTTVADASREKTYLSAAQPTAASENQANSLAAGEKEAAQTELAAASSTRPGATTSPGVTIAQLARLLRSLALMETRQVTPFIDAAHSITRAADADQGTAEQITQLIAAYAKMLIWCYPVLRALAERLLRMDKSEVTLSHLVTAQLALLRMDVTFPSFTARFYEELSQMYKPATGQSRVSATGHASLSDRVVQLSILSRLRGHPSETPIDDAVVEVLIERIVAHSDHLKVDEVAEVLLSLSRLGKGNSAAFGSLNVRTLGMLPKSPPRVMAHVVEAYALAGRGDDTELFTLVADRTVAMRHEMASVTIASVLASFAKAGVRNDRLFIEVIPRVRHVATYGTPRDVVNVVSAYAAVNLWHYKLFARLADRAIQLRADFRTPEVVALLKAYATVQMRYDRLFTEFSPRIQTLVHLLSPADLTAIVSSYAQLDIRCPPVWKATAAQAVTVARSFSLEDAKTLLEAYASQSFFNEECVSALTDRFPELASISWGSAETLADGKESSSRGSDGSESEHRGQSETSQGV
ncbi:conserved hypothetical protein [Leishmania mexicana MHOM/GT/2001/U1103]|uniref:RNA-editing substrate-binding complex 6 protein domain-containing protein n=1 Tax=Leishmania mexicana (strain MHOM/GT/2001/U1103) TaxID=929439 RepID=E9ATP6_LEIMU|nr:conserved hypothetical protein [Leishmania mexicana MHOM/GT/2001/U1103]CBZ26321.1 conserved hypothetical protein [Leishmania mexicana MHOM/GT/2001/U1103]